MNQPINPYPRVSASLRPDGSSEVTFNGTSWPVTGAGTDVSDARAQAVRFIAQRASETVARPVLVTVVDPQGTWQLTVQPDGTVPAAELVGPTATAAVESPAPSEHSPVLDLPEYPVIQAPAAPAIPAWQQPPAEAPADDLAPSTATAPPEPGGRREARESFLSGTQAEPTAATGWRGALGRFGVKMQPSRSELERRADEAAVSQHWPGTRTVAVVNGKGGASKSPSVALLSAVFARYGGGGVLAWDNNETRGTLGWRTEQGPHEATVRDLLPHAQELVAPSARAAEVAAYVHHQVTDKYDVLRSSPHLLSNQQRLSAQDFGAVHDVAAKYFRLLMIDSGNDEAAANWLAMIDHANQIVLPMRAEDEHAEAGALLLDALHARDAASSELASRAVVIVSEARSSATDQAEAIAAGFRPLVREVATIPYDPAMVGGLLRFDTLRPGTQRAWLRAAAAVARGL